tara:strand:+ start:2574 stop:7163 length:4590 start_codon:yes stop_codon:yes gene_type:complete
MPSRFEIYKSSISSDRELDTDLNELEKLYNSRKEFKKNYNFDEFVNLSIQNSDKQPDISVQEFYNPPKPKDNLKDNPKYYEKLFGYTSQEKKEIEENVRGWESTRRAIVSPMSETVESILHLGRSVVAPKNTLSPVRGFLDTLIPNKKEISRTVDKVFRKIGGSDIYDIKTDAETGEEYYELEKPTTTAEAIIRPVGELAIGMAVTKKPTAGGLASLKKVFSAPARKRGRQSKAQKELEALANIRKTRIDKYTPLIKAEVGAQFAFADDPDFNIVAGALSNYIGDDDNRLSDLFNYLDTDEDSPEIARRLSLLLDGVVMSSGIGLLSIVGKGAVKGLTKIVNDAKAGGDEAVGKFKEVIDTARKSESASKKINKPKEIDVPMVTNLEGVANNSFMNQTWILLQKGYQGLKTRDGMYAPGTLDIIKKSEYNKIAWSRRAMDIHSKLYLNIQKATKKRGGLKQEEIEDLLGLYLTEGKKNGKVVVLKTLPKDVREYAEIAKNQIAALSTMLGKSKHVPKEIKDIINANLNKYLRKTYEAFENPDYTPSKELIARAEEVIKKGLRSTDINSGRVRPRPKGYYEQEASKAVNKLLNKNNKTLFNNFESHVNGVFGAKKAEKLFATRKNINPVIDELLGGNVPASTSVFRSIETMTHQLSQYKLMDDLYDDGLGKWFFKGTGKNSVAPDPRMVEGTIKGKGFHKLNGVQTTPQIASLFEKMKGEAAGDSLMNNVVQMYGQFLKVKGFTQAAATVYNATTHVRNTVGGGLILARNGMNPFTSDTVDSFKMLKNELATSSLSKNKALTKIYDRYQELGLVNQNVRVGEFKSLMKEFTKDKPVDLNKTMLSRVNKKVTDVYVAEDDLWRIAGFNKELNTLVKANKISTTKKTTQQLEQEAADIIRNTMPTYDLIAPSIQRLRQLPIGNFFSFTAEQYRNNYHTIVRGMDEIRSGNEVLVERGMKRLSSQIAVTYGMGKGATDLSKNLYGITDEDEKAIRNLDLAPWSKNSALVFNRDEDGNIEYIDLTYTDPTAPVTDVMRTFLNEVMDTSKPTESVAKKIRSGISESALLFLKPFTGPSILTDRIIESVFNKGIDYETGRYIENFNPLEGTSINNVMAQFKHMGEVIIPREITDTYSIIAGKKSDKIKKGELKLGDELFAKFTGQRTQVLTPSKIQKDFSFKMYALSQDLETANQSFKRNIKSGVTSEKLLKDFKRANDSFYDSFVKGKLALEAASHFNLTNRYISSTASKYLSEYNASEKNNFLTHNNSFIPLRITEASLQKIRKQANTETMGFRQFLEEYNSLLSDYSHLPIVEMEENKSKTYSEQKLEERNMKATGGLVEGKDDVPQTKEDPADRVNPITGLPYSDQMDRLGFSDGEKVKINRATRNNNPFNLVYGPAIGAGNINWEGKLEYDPNVEKTFERFKDNTYGVRAGVLNTLTHYERGKKTVEQLIKSHAPLKGDIVEGKLENPNQRNFINMVSSMLGVKPNQEINLQDPKVMKKYVKGIARFEGHQNLQESDIDEGTNLAFQYRNN